MSFKPEVGLVLRYDFLWKEDQLAGAYQGSKDRPCAIVLAVKSDEDKSSRVVVCPITHSPPSNKNAAIEISPKIAAHLGLDEQKMWIKTDAVNQFTWDEKTVPMGVTPARVGEWAYGMLPDKVSKDALEQVRANSRSRMLGQVKRDDPQDTYEQNLKKRYENKQDNSKPEPEKEKGNDKDSERER